MECVPEVEVSEKKVDKLQEEDEKEENQHPVQKADSFFSILKDLLDLVVGGVLNVASYFMSIFGGVDEDSLGFEKSEDLDTRDRVYSYSKRKRPDEQENESENETQENSAQELKMKKWRPDVVLLAVERFIYNLLGETETGENENENQKDDNDENMNSFVSADDYQTPGHGDNAWSKKPNFNFFSDSVIDDINDVDAEGQSAPSPSEVSPLDKNASKLFVFSADKHLKEGDFEESDKAEEVISPFPTFEERQAYFNEQILIQEAEALKGMNKSESPEKK